MSEASTIKKTKQINTIDTLTKQFKQMGIEKGDVLLVHSSLSSIGWVCGGAVAVLAALRNAVGSTGTVCMPAHSGENSDPRFWSNPPVPKDWFDEIYASMPPFDPAITPTRGMGKIAELFRTVPGTLRSDHPQVSFCANGPQAERIVEEHTLTPAFGEQTPLGSLYRLNAKVLLIGVGYDNCTCLHLAETRFGKIPKVMNGSAVMKDGQRKWEHIRDYNYSVEHFKRIGRAFEKSQAVSPQKLGESECRIFAIADCVDFAVDWLFDHHQKKEKKHAGN